MTPSSQSRRSLMHLPALLVTAMLGMIAEVPELQPLSACAALHPRSRVGPSQSLLFAMPHKIAASSPMMVPSLDLVKASCTLVPRSTRASAKDSGQPRTLLQSTLRSEEIVEHE